MESSVSWLWGRGSFKEDGSEEWLRWKVSNFYFTLHTYNNVEFTFFEHKNTA
jgi:hypothetical protein